MAKRRPGLQADAADPRAVKNAKRRAKDRRKRALDELRAVLATVEGRAVIYRLLEHARVFESVFSERPGLLPYLAGRQDFGHYIMGEVDAAEPEALFAMMREASARRRRDDAEDAAEQIPRAHDGDGEDSGA